MPVALTEVTRQRVRPRKGKADMRTAHFRTEPFTCPSCIAKIEGVVGKKAGVESARVLFNSDKVTVRFDENVVSAQELADSISGLGYPVLSHKVVAEKESSPAVA
jgi:copper chaperone CopZ